MLLSNNNRTNSNISNSTAKPSSEIILSKAEEGLNSIILRLKEEKGIDLSKHFAKTFVIMDRSGSMEKLYLNGSVQTALTRLLPLALRFSGNKELEVYLSNENCTRLPISLNLSNYQNYVNGIILKRGFHPSGGTRYSPAIERTITCYNDKPTYPAFGIFITDGDNFDRVPTDKAIIKSSKYKIFYQFVGIGNSNFNYLKNLNKLDGRSVDNTDFVKISDFSELNYTELYTKLLEKYPYWLKAMKIK